MKGASGRMKGAPGRMKRADRRVKYRGDCLARNQPAKNVANASLSLPG